MYVLSVIHPPEEGAAFGKAEVLDPVNSRDTVWRRVFHVLETDCDDLAIASAGADEVTSTHQGVEVRPSGTGIAFRIDPVDNAPHPCPCCDRLVLPTDHAYANAEDAYCLGCFTWSRNVEACLPENTAHSHKEN